MESREVFPDGHEWSVGPLKGPGVVGRPSWRVGRPSRMAMSGREALPEGREWSGRLSR